MSESNTDDLKAKIESQYDRFAEKFTALYESSQEKGREAMERTLERTREQLTAAGEMSAEQGEKFKAYLKRDLEQSLDDMHRLGEEARERFNPSRLSAGALASLSMLLQSAGKGLDFLSRKTQEALTYHTGEVTSAGTLTCIKCNREVHMTKTGHVPPCPACHGTEFRKSY
ncbi:MAG: hypothetical protein GC151_15725 [Betaproteobacteria bacterium]|nr:hypothetical protein [Betaproteobacteria bacterium]